MRRPEPAPAWPAGRGGVGSSPGEPPPVKSRDPFSDLPPTLYFLLVRENFLEWC